MKLLLGNCLDVLKTMDENSVHSVVTDPPYGLAFMNKKWDYDVPSVEIWKEVLRVLKPGGHLLSFGGTRTYHRMVVNIEDAGFEIRDQIQWIYGSGFPKSLNIGKAIDKAAGAERKVIGTKLGQPGYSLADNGRTNEVYGDYHNPIAECEITAPATESAKQWDGWGTALKPANEPIVLARKPLDGTVAENIEKWDVGGLNIDGCRIETADNLGRNVDQTQSWKNTSTAGVGSVTDDWKKGRWPANVMFDEKAAEMLDEQSGPCKTGNIKPHKNAGSWKQSSKEITSSFVTDSATGASRFFYCAKASKRERNAGLENMPIKKLTFMATSNGTGNPSSKIDTNGKERDRFTASHQNHHPTVKPIKLMEHLCRLVTPPNGVILDPFMGSGSTGIAAKNLGFDFIGMEYEKEYWEIAQKRING